MLAACVAAATALAPTVPAAGAEDDEVRRYRHRESLTVTDTRLRDEPEETTRVPAHVTVLTERDVRRSGARTLQELLEREAGAMVYDQVGNGVGRTFDLRGFTSGTGTRVFLDGAPLNDPRSNATFLELVPLEALERVEVTRGSTAALAGGGSQAGVINLWTGGEGSSFSLAAGDFGTLETSGSLRRRVGRTELGVAGAFSETDGFRDNAGGELSRLSARAGWELAGGGHLALSVTGGESDYGQPGALTLAEATADRERAPFNRLDFSREALTQAAVNYRTPLTSRLSLSANLYARERESEILSTGRAASLFGGFFLDSEAAVRGATVQLGRAPARPDRGHDLAVGLEWLDGETDARGFFTPSADPGRVDPAAPGSDNTAERDTLALYLHDSWRLGEAWTVTLGARFDRDEVGYGERVPDPSNRAERRFEELSLRAGVNWAATAQGALYLSVGESFLPPTVEQLFSFPRFGSNPDLQPEDSRGLEAGFKHRGALELDLAVFRIDSENAIVFDPDSPLGLFGANENAGEARRQGIEARLRTQPTVRVGLRAAATLLDAELTSGPDRGRRLPLVPEERLAVGLDLDVAGGFALRIDGQWIGEQVLDNDEANAQARLDGYAVVDARLTWGPGRDLAAVLDEGWRLFVEARNLLDETYATRGIFAFDFATFENAVFVTPAPGRRLMAGIEWSR